MKFGQTYSKKWHSSEELNKQYNSLSKSFNRLGILEYVWKKCVGKKEIFWVLTAVKKDSLCVSVKAAVARTELMACRYQLVNELNKYFDEPWIKKIEIL